MINSCADEILTAGSTKLFRIKAEHSFKMIWDLQPPPKSQAAQNTVQKSWSLKLYFIWAIKEQF